MRGRELYRRILGIEAPWWAGHVELKLEADKVQARQPAVRGAPAQSRRVMRPGSVPDIRRGGW